MRPGWGALQALSFVRNFRGFVVNSSRSYANYFWLKFGSGRFVFSVLVSDRRESRTMQGIRQCVLQHAFCSNKRRARSDAPYLSRVFRLRHEFVSPGDMQIFASAEAKICYPVGNFNLSSERALPFVVWLSTPHPGPPSEAEREN